MATMSEINETLREEYWSMLCKEMHQDGIDECIRRECKEFNIPPDAGAVTLSPDQIKRRFEIAKEIISNAH